MSSTEFSAPGQGHIFVCRTPLSKATARKCCECSMDVFAHSREEVLDSDLMSILEATQDGTPSMVCVDELMVGGYKSVLKCGDEVRVVNCAGTMIHDFIPATRCKLCSNVSLLAALLLSRCACTLQDCF